MAVKILKINGPYCHQSAADSLSDWHFFKRIICENFSQNIHWPLERTGHVMSMFSIVTFFFCWG